MEIDLVLFYEDSSDSEWLNKLSAYVGMPLIADPYDEEKLKWCLKSIDSNLFWINKIFLVVPNKNQLPDWIAGVNSVEYNDFLPKELINCVSPTVAKLFVHRIPDLSNNFLLMDNNCFVLKRLSEEQFFAAGMPQVMAKPEHCGNESMVRRAMTCNQYRHFMQNEEATSILRITSSIIPGNKTLWAEFEALYKNLIIAKQAQNQTPEGLSAEGIIYKGIYDKRIQSNFDKCSCMNLDYDLPSTYIASIDISNNYNRDLVYLRQTRVVDASLVKILFDRLEQALEVRIPVAKSIYEK